MNDGMFNNRFFECGNGLFNCIQNRDDVVVLFWLKKENHDNQNHSIICFVSRRSNETEYFLMLSKSV